jgi:hypothetical protein
MLVNLRNPCWWYMEIPRTGSTTVDRSLRKDFPLAKAAYPKHWPVVPTQNSTSIKSITTIRNPYSRAVSCWQFFTKPGQIEFVNWLEDKAMNGFFEIGMEARPQFFWYRLAKWDYIVRQEQLEQDYWAMMNTLAPDLQIRSLPRVNATNGMWLNKVRVKTKREKPWPDYYSPRAEEAVRAIYATDFIALKDFYSQTFPGTIS